MNRKIYYWKLSASELQLGEKTLLMGVLNVTPDSFSDGGHYNDPDRAYARALELEEEGADIIDIGAESTRPGSERISVDEEWRRLIPVLKKLRGNLRVPISLDTYKSEIAERAFEYGVEIINDPSALTFDANLAKVVANANAGLILNHMRGAPESWAKLPPMPDPVGTITRDLDATVSRARRAGVDRTRIVLDPGLGFGKRKEQNAEVLAHLSKLAVLDHPIMTGPSRKSFLAQPTEDETMYATAAAVTASILNGAHIVRVHDVKQMRAVAQVTDEIARASAASARAAELVAGDRPVPRLKRAEAGQYSAEEKVRPTRPPVSRPVVSQPAPEPMPEATPVVDEHVESAPIEVSEPKPERIAPPTPSRAPRKDFGDARPPRKTFGDARPPRKTFSDDRPPRKSFGDARPPRKDFGDARPPRKDYGDARPPRKDFGDARPPRKDYSDARPPRRDYADSRPPRKEFGDARPPRKDFSGPRPPRKDFGDARPPRKTFGDRPQGDRPPRKTFGERGARPDGPPRRSFGDGPPRRDYPDKGDRGPREGRSGPPRGPFKGGPSRGGPPRTGPPRGGPPRGGDDRGPSRPPSRPFRKRP